VSLAALAVAAALLAVERASYAVVARLPGTFARLCARLAPSVRGGPVAVVGRLGWAFKMLQVTVFGLWCWVHGGVTVSAEEEPLVLPLAGTLVAVGQMLVLTTFYRLGRIGVFFGDRFGYQLRRCREFPFSLLAHPQYVGTVLTIWGLFLVRRFPHDDWYALPVVETLYYAVATRLESPGEPVQSLRKTMAPM
jgi:phosphatidyl-N-methylethanolamine N-methyltransferase